MLTMISDIPLAGYASRFWVYHARFEKVSARIHLAMVHLFDVDQPQYAAWLRIHDIDDGWGYFSDWSTIGTPVPLYYAAQCGFYDLVEHLISKYPEKVDAEGGLNRTPLAAALYGGHFHVAELLYRHGATVNARGYSQRTLLQGASWDGHINAVRWLLNHGADVNAQGDDQLWTPLHEAAYRGNLQVFRMLVEHEADVNIRTGWGESPLHLAAHARNHHDHLDVMQLLLDHGVDPNARDNDESTPLHYSSFYKKPNYESSRGTVEGTRLLLKHGANIDAVDREGRTPLQIALAHGRQDIVAVLLEHGAMQ